MNLLTFTTLFPNAAMPSHGIFVENRLRQLIARSDFTAQVLAPTPWFPSRHKVFGAYAKYADIPKEERRHGISIRHPRYPIPPRIGMNSSPFLLYLAARKYLAKMIKDGFCFDLIDAHFFYPDGVAAVMLGKAFNKPVVITARGSDLSEYPAFPIPRRLVQWAAHHCDGIITVAQALMTELEKIAPNLPHPPEQRRVLRNGVDLITFSPGNRARQRAGLAVCRPTLISVGHLIPRKAHDLVIEAMVDLPEFDLLIVGEGPERTQLENLIARHGLNNRVRLLGQQPHDRLPDIYGAADAMILASSREGWANVLLESMACGTPVVASNVWGTPEVVSTPAAGRLMTERTPTALAASVRNLFANYPDRAATRAYACGFSWESTSLGQMELFKAVLSARNACP